MIGEDCSIVASISCGIVANIDGISLLFRESPHEHDVLFSFAHFLKVEWDTPFSRWWCGVSSGENGNPLFSE